MSGTMKRIALFALINLLFVANSQAQDTSEKQVVIDGKVVTAKIQDGDTIIVADLDSVTVTSFRTFDSDTQYRMYNKYRRYAGQVYPYAVQAIKIFREVERDTKDLKKRKRKKHVRQLQKDLKQEFTDPLKNLSRTQGKILIKMIENELDTPMYELLKGLKGGFAASKWQTVGKLYGYDLKTGYVIGEDAILDAVLQDFDVSYSVE